MSSALGVLDLLRVQGFDYDTRRFKLVRHQEGRYDLHDFLRRGWLEAYQAFQNKPVFRNVDRIVSFIGVGHTQARLVGVYDVLGHSPRNQGLVPAGCPLADHWLGLNYFYEMRRAPGFEELDRARRLSEDSGGGLNAN
jgi:hypothetical protein